MVAALCNSASNRGWILTGMQMSKQHAAARQESAVVLKAEEDSLLGKLAGMFGSEASEVEVLEPPMPRRAAAAGAVEPTKTLSAQDVACELQKGNMRFLTKSPRSARSGTSALMEDPFRPIKKKVVVLTCAYLDIPLHAIFDVEAAEIQSIRAMGGVSGDHDGVMGSVDYSLSKEDAPPLMLVLGDSSSEPLKAALRTAMDEAGIDGAPASNQRLAFIEEKDMGLVKKLLPVCRDALTQMPEAPFDTLLEIAVKLNVWYTIQTLMATSPTVFAKVANGFVDVQGGYVNTATGAVQLMGRHPSLTKLLKTPPADDRVRTASSPSVPPEEAYAQLVSGNRRYAKKQGAMTARADAAVLMQLGKDGQQPLAAVLGCADSRAPVELNFDKQPGDLFVLRTAGNIIPGGKGALLGSTEFAISVLNTKLVLVLGHTQCGAVTEAVKAVRTNTDLGDVPGSMGNLLADLSEAAEEAIRQLPDADVAEQVALAIKLNVFNGIQRLIEHSEIVRSSVMRMEVAVHGAIYDIVTGKVEFLGQHPALEKLVGAPMPFHNWKVTPYRSILSPMGPAASKCIEKLRAGNFRFVGGNGGGKFQGMNSETEPMAILVSGTEGKVPAQVLFDTAPGELVVQRCLGNIVGAQGGSLFNSLEYAVVRFNPPVLVVLGESDDEVVREAVEQVQGSKVPPLAMRAVLDQVSVSAVRALEQVGGLGAVTTAGADMKVKTLSVEFNVLYAVEQLMLNSAIIREAVRGGMEVHGAILDRMSGEVKFMGPHPMAKELIALAEARHNH